mmetsp:Transcript_32679/g.45584  ORF Transcript_32679/g.45584 Transcript_32679/m.45584 type:complete len:455 (-) Transcript_32679:610-1974(-)
MLLRVAKAGSRALRSSFARCATEHKRWIRTETAPEGEITEGDPLGTGIKEADPLVIVSAYTNVDTLAHQPRGKSAHFGFYVYKMNTTTGGLTLASVCPGVDNPAFSRYHPSKDVLYTATESILENGVVVTYKVHSDTGKLEEVHRQDAGGASTCYLTVDRNEENMLFVNYWDSTLGTFPLNIDGTPEDKVKLIETKFDASDAVAKRPKPAQTGEKKHDANDPETAAERQTSAHAHSIVLDPYLGTVAYVPDLGQDCIHQYYLDQKTGALDHRGKIPADTVKGPLGPRYIDFHKKLNVAYVINEMSCGVAVFQFDPTAIEEIKAGGNRHSLEQIQTISTVPEGFPSIYNTCGRICVDPTGRFVLVSNRGHDSITVFRILHKERGMLARVGWCHTRGTTPRHFAFDDSGRYLIAANQDSNSISVFEFNPSNGLLEHTGNDYVVPSPNFICVKTPHT